MNKIYLFLLASIFFACSFNLSAQKDTFNHPGFPILKESSVAEEEEAKIFMIAEQMPEFPGGMEALKAYLKTWQYPPIAEDVEGTVYVSFVIRKDDNVSDVEVKKGVAEALDKEAVHLIQSMPRWSPGKQNGIAVDVKYIVPVHITF